MKGAAFDLDGCLVESRTAIVPSMRAAFATLDLPEPSEDQLHELIGPPLELGIAALLRDLGEDPDRAASVVLAYRADYREHMLDRTTLQPGVDAAVRTIAMARTLCIVTSKPTLFSTMIVEHLGLLDAFAFVEGPSFAMQQETKETTLARAMDRLELGVMVGDRHHDIDAGRAHGLATVGVLWGMGDRAELADADHIVATPDALVGLLT